MLIKVNFTPTMTKYCRLVVTR